MKIYLDGGTSIVDAAQKLNVSYRTANSYFRKCADIIAEANTQRNETWLEQRERVLDRAMEGLTRRKNEALEAKLRIGGLLYQEYKKYKEIPNEAKALYKDLQATEEELLRSSPEESKSLIKAKKLLQGMIFTAHEDFKATIPQITALERQYKDNQEFIVSLQEKYDVLAASPPAKQILQAELELYLEKKEEPELIRRNQ